MLVEHRTKYAAVGSPETVPRWLDEMINETRADKIIITAQIYDHKARLHSFEIAAKIVAQINAARQR